MGSPHETFGVSSPSFKYEFNVNLYCAIHILRHALEGGGGGMAQRYVG